MAAAATSYSSYHHEQSLRVDLNPLPCTSYYHDDAFGPAFVFKLRHCHHWGKLVPADNPDGYTYTHTHTPTLSPFTATLSSALYHSHSPLGLPAILAAMFFDLNLHLYYSHGDDSRDNFISFLIHSAHHAFNRFGHCVMHVEITTVTRHTHDPEGLLDRAADAWLDSIRDEEEERNVVPLGMVPAASDAVEKTLATGKVTEEREDEECVICLGEIPSGSEAIALPCSHAFHGDCVARWLKSSHFCPLCRFEMPV